MRSHFVDRLRAHGCRAKSHSQVARDSYAKMAQIDANSWQVQTVRAELYADEERHADAVKEYEAAIRLQGHNADLYEGRGDEYRHMNDLESSQQAYAKEVE